MKVDKRERHALSHLRADGERAPARIATEKETNDRSVERKMCPSPFVEKEEYDPEGK